MTRLLTARWVLAASPKLSRSLGTLNAWTDAPWIGWGSRLSNVAPARWLTKHARGVEPIVQSDSLMVQLAVAGTGTGVALVPEPSLAHYRLVHVKVGKGLAEGAAEWPADDLYLVTHRALRDVPRVRAVWDLLVERMGER